MACSAGGSSRSTRPPPATAVTGAAPEGIQVMRNPDTIARRPNGEFDTSAAHPESSSTLQPGPHSQSRGAGPALAASNLLAAQDLGRCEGLAIVSVDPNALQAGDTVVYKRRVLDIIERDEFSPAGRPGVPAFRARVRDASTSEKGEGTITFSSGTAHAALRDDDERAQNLVALGATNYSAKRRGALRRAADAPYEDTQIGGMTPKAVRSHFGFASMPEHTRSHLPLGGPVGICKETRQGVPGFRVSDMRTGASLRVGSKRTANKIAKQIDDDMYGRRGYDELDAQPGAEAAAE